MSCINTSSQEFKHLLLMSKMSEPLLKAKVALWQRDHGLDAFPSMEELKTIKDIVATVPGATYTSSKGFPMQNSNLEKLEDRTKTVTIRQHKYPSGVYKFGKFFYQVTLVNPNMSKASDIGNIAHLRKKFTDEELKFQHVQDFFDDKKPAYIYQILKLDTTAQMSYTEAEKQEALAKSQPDRYKNQIVNLQRSIGRVKAAAKKHKPGTAQYEKFKAMEVAMNDMLAKYKTTKNKAYLYNLATMELDNIEALIIAYEKGSREASVEVVSGLLKKLDSLYELSEKDIPQRVDNLRDRYISVMQHIVKTSVDTTSNKKEDLSYDELQADKRDISGLNMWTGALVNSDNRIARTIGMLIKTTQIKISGEQGAIYEKVKHHTEKLKIYAKANGMNMKQVYNLFIQDLNNTTVLTRPYTTEFYEKLNASLKAKDKLYLNFAKWDTTTNRFVPINKVKYANPNYTTIFKNGNEELANFYKFYQETIKESLERLPDNEQTERLKNNPEDFIPNLYATSLVDIAKAEGFVGKLKFLAKYITGMQVYEIKDTDMVKDEALERDIISLKYITKLTGDEKSRDLGESLFKFAAMSIEHENLSNILPQTRLLQRSLADNTFINPHKRGLAVEGKDSNIYNMVDKFIEMQVLGKKTTGKDEFTVGTLYDEKTGEEIGKKVIKMGELADFGLKWNSLLRIGLNPITAFTNLAVGEIGNAIEAMGGRFFDRKDLTSATGIFFSQIHKEDSKTRILIEKYPMLQELTDYEYAANISVKQGIYGLTGEKLKNYMYSMQKGGEVFLQTRTMIAMMLHTKPDGKTSLWEMLDDKGELKPEFLKHFGTQEEFQDYMLRNSTRIMGVNEQIHGRYSTRDAAILNQNVLFRMAFQFKKWIPAAVETRLGRRQYNDRLMVETEGRWITFKNLVFDLRKSVDRYNKGELSEMEIYNLRKTMTEIAIFSATMLAAIAMGWDDDDKRKKSASYKFAMDQLDKVSGDLLFFANPKNVTRLTKNPFALTKLADQLVDVVAYIPYIAYGEGSEIKAGAHKGENKFYRSLGQITPGYNQSQNVLELFNERKYVSRVK
jgi:hypothetical protein